MSQTSLEDQSMAFRLVDESTDPPQDPNNPATAGLSHLNVGVSRSNRSARALGVAIAACFLLCAVWWAGLNKTVSGATSSPASIIVDYPINNSVFPPDM